MKFVFVKDKDSFILHSKCNGLWYSADARSRSISSHAGVDIVIQEFLGCSTTRVKIIVTSVTARAEYDVSLHVQVWPCQFHLVGEMSTRIFGIITPPPFRNSYFFKLQPISFIYSTDYSCFADSLSAVGVENWTKLVGVSRIVAKITSVILKMETSRWVWVGKHCITMTSHARHLAFQITAKSTLC